MPGAPWNTTLFTRLLRRTAALGRLADVATRRGRLDVAERAVAQAYQVTHAWNGGDWTAAHQWCDLVAAKVRYPWRYRHQEGA